MITRENAEGKEEGLHTGGLRTGSLEGAKGLGPAKPFGAVPEPIAENYSKDLSGANGASAQVEAIIELAKTAAAEEMSKLMITGPSGQSISGKFPHFTLHYTAPPGKRRGFTENLDYRAPEPFEIVAVEGAIFVEPGLISGFTDAGSDIVPQIESTNMFDRPEFSASGLVQWVMARAEVELTTAPNADTPPVYYVANVELTEEWELVLQTDEVPGDAVKAAFNTATGETTPGVYYIHIGTFQEVGDTVQIEQLRIGNWSIGFCAATCSISVVSPSKNRTVIYNVTTPDP